MIQDTQSYEDIYEIKISDLISTCSGHGSDIFYIPNNGNLGDALITAGTLSTFRQAGISVQLFNNHPLHEKMTVIIAGGGNLVPYYHDVSSVLSRLMNSSVGRVVVLPHTISGHTTLLERLDERFNIICRDRTSFAHVHEHHKGPLFLAHDMATQVKPKQLHTDYTNVIGRANQQILFAVERILRSAADHSHANNRHGRLFRRDIESARDDDKVSSLDLSALQIHTWGHPVIVTIMADTFLRAIAMFDSIETDRLHVAIAGGLLGLPVHFYANSYFKNQAVFDYTIKDIFPSVVMT